jgi:alpha-tubulin suppressor-like RCC1 family protein
MPLTFASEAAPTPGANGRTFKALTVGGHSQTCGVNADDDVVYCFGHNDFSQVGRGTRSGHDSAVAPTGGAPRGLAVTTTEFYSCLLTLEGQPMCWGDDDMVPTAVASPEPLTTIAIGGAQRCAFGVSRTLYCWGLNTSGETGVGSASNGIGAPTVVNGGVRFDDVFPGAFATCAVPADGALYCWGNFHPRSLSSRLGDARYSPVRILPTLRFKSVAIHVGRTCGVTLDGRLYCWQ